MCFVYDIRNTNESTISTSRPMFPWPTEHPAEQLHSLRTTSLAKLVRDDVLAAILDGALAPGQRINEPDVAGRLKVSRVPVREALRELESSGVVVSRKHAGVFVRQLSASEVRDLYQLRALLDGFAGRVAAMLPKAARDALIGVLDGATAAMKSALQSADTKRYYAENLRFHWAIVEAAGNPQMAEVYRGIVQKLHISRLKNLSDDGGKKASIAEHIAIVKSLRQGDAPNTEARMAAHVEAALARLQKSISQKSIQPETPP
jgi:DNA-binding GntR family transcriptional regulator